MPDLPLDRLARLSARAIVRLAEEDSKCIGREPLQPQDWRVIRYGLTSARTLRQALVHCADCFEAINGRCGIMRVYRRGGVIEVELDPGRTERSPRACLIDLTGVAQIHAMLAWLIDRAIPLTCVRLNHDGESFADLGLSRLPFALELDASRTSFSFAAAYLDHPVVRTVEDDDEGGTSNFLFELGEVGQAHGSAAEKVRELAMRSLRGDGAIPPFADIAPALGQSTATLRRRLTEDGTSYRAIRNSCRRELGFELLRSSDSSIENISLQLDFCDSDAFRRAFRAWTGISPSQYRRDSRPVARR